MRKITFIIFCLLCHIAMGQTPGWASKGRKGIFSIITYDDNNKILNTGNGFYINEKGEALSDFTLFKGASRAVVIDMDGKQSPVESILGINAIYDVIKFKVKVDKKISYLNVAEKKSAKAETVYLLPYSTQKEEICRSGLVEKIDSIENNNAYYTIRLRTTDKTISCPIMNSKGEVIGLVQKGASNDDPLSYAVSASLGKKLTIPTMGTNSYPYNGTKIKKALPEDENQALVALFVAASGDQKLYESMLDDFIANYPNSSEGYLRHALFLTTNYRDANHFEKAEKDLEQALKLAKSKDDILYNYSKIIYNNAILEPSFTYKDWSLDKALDLIDQAKKINALPLYDLHKGNIYYAQKEYQKAYDSYDAVNQSNLASSESYFCAAKSLEQLNQTDQAIALTDTAVAKSGKELLLYLDESAQMKSRAGKNRDAVKDYNEIYSKLNGQVNATFYYNRSSAEMKCKMYKQGLEDIEKAVEMDPTNAIFLVELSSAYIRVNKIDEAIDAAQKSIDANPNLADSYRLLGFCQYQKGMKEEALKNLNRAKELGDDKAISLIEKYSK